MEPNDPALTADPGLEDWHHRVNRENVARKNLTDFFMTYDLRRPETSPRDFEARLRITEAHAVTNPVVQDLEQLRELVLERLSSIESLARKHGESAQPERDWLALEESFKKKSAELEESRRQLRVQAERERQEWIAAMSQLEDDRRLLAEAWARIDQERTGAMSALKESALAYAPRPHSQTAVSTSAPALGPAVPTGSAEADSGSSNPVAQAILQQFQTLCSDVRQNARARRASR